MSAQPYNPAHFCAASPGWKRLGDHIAFMELRVDSDFRPMPLLLAHGRTSPIALRKVVKLNKLTTVDRASKDSLAFTVDAVVKRGDDYDVRITLADGQCLVVSRGCVAIRPIDRDDWRVFPIPKVRGLIPDTIPRGLLADPDYYFASRPHLRSLALPG